MQRNQNSQKWVRLVIQDFSGSTHSYNSLTIKRVQMPNKKRQFLRIQLMISGGIH